MTAESSTTITRKGPPASLSVPPGADLVSDIR
jgi:hypothetical protein